MHYFSISVSLPELKHSLTRRQMARTSISGLPKREEVEPSSNVARAEEDARYW